MLLDRMPLLAVLAISVSSGWAGTITQTLGHQDFADGAIVASGTFIGIADTGPFNTVIGADNSTVGPNFSASWTFAGYGSVVGSIVSATLLIASWEFDTNNNAGSQVGSFNMNGTNLAAILDAAFEANQTTAGNQIRWYTITLPASTFAQLATGSATFNLALQNGAGALGNTTFNGGGMDFSTLTIETQAAASTPEPSTALAVLGGLAGVVLLRKKRRTA